MSEPTYEELMKMNVDDAVPQAALPAGHYVGVILVPEKTESSQKGTPGWLYPVRLQSAKDDVDPASLKAALTDPNGNEEKLTDRVVKGNDVTFWVSKRAMPMHREFLEETLGLNITGRPFEAVIPQAAGKQVVLIASQKLNKRGRPYNEWAFAQS